MLPVRLPETEDFKPPGTGESPLAKLEAWVNTVSPSRQPARRETNTMPQWAGSCWYYLRFLDPANDRALVDSRLEKYWMPVDLYVGGAEHAVLHLLYARFWHKVLHDIGVVSTPEPFMRLVHPGTVLGEDGQKMSKSVGNVVNPDDMVDEYGADALRLYEMFMGPLEASKPWSTKGVEGITRFLDRVWRLFVDEDGSLSRTITAERPAPDSERLLHRTIKKVTEDLDDLKFNTAIAQMMVFVNEVTKLERRPRALLEPFVLILSPFAPHLGEELWHRLGHGESLAYASWPAWDPGLVIEDVVTVAVQVNGKLRATLTLPRDSGQDAAKAAALGDERVRRYVDGDEVRKVIYVPNKLLNLVVGGK
jgi:leucyl-tRNA synthetase